MDIESSKRLEKTSVATISIKWLNARTKHISKMGEKLPFVHTFIKLKTINETHIL